MPPARSCRSKRPGARIHSAHLTMPQLAEILSRRLGYPVLDMISLAVL
jgi:hypothetical protein